MASIGLVEGAGSLNPTQQAFDSRTDHLQKQRLQTAAIDQAEQDRKDNDMLQVFKYAGDGFVDEARYVAKSKGLQVPEEIFANSDFAKGLGLAGELYGDDKEGAQKFAMAWAQTQGNVQDRILSASKVAGAPQDRTLQRQMALEKWKHDNGIGGSTPAAIQVGDQLDSLYWKARDPNATPDERLRADMAYNHLRQGGKLDDKGIRYNLYTPEQNYTPVDPLQGQAQQKPVYAPEQPHAPVPPAPKNSDSFSADMAFHPQGAGQRNLVQAGVKPQDPLEVSRNAVQQANAQGIKNPYQTMPEAPVTITPQQGYGEAVGANAAKVAGMEQQAKKDVDLAMNPQIEAAESRSVYMEEGYQKLPKAQRALQSQELREEFLAPKFQSIRERANGLTTDWGGALLGVLPGTAAYDLRRDVDTLLANAGFDRLQEMRDNSVTGGALGQVSEMELQLLQAAAQSLMASQSREQFIMNLNQFEQQRIRSLENVRRAYDQDYHRFGGQRDQYLPAPQTSQQPQSPQVPQMQGGAVDYKSKYGLE